MSKIEINYLNSNGNYDALYPMGSCLAISQETSFIGNSSYGTFTINMNLSINSIRNYGVPLLIYIPETNVTSDANSIYPNFRNVSTVHTITSFSVQAIFYLIGKSGITYLYKGLVYLYNVKSDQSVLGLPSTFIPASGTCMGPETAIPGSTEFKLEPTSNCSYEVFNYGGNPLNINKQTYNVITYVLRGGPVIG